MRHHPAGGCTNAVIRRMRARCAGRTGAFYPYRVTAAPDDLSRLEAFTYLTVPERVGYLAVMRLLTACLMTDLSAQQVVEELAGHDIELSLDTAVSRPSACSWSWWRRPSAPETRHWATRSPTSSTSGCAAN